MGETDRCRLPAHDEDRLVESSPGPVFIYTRDGELVYANEAAAAFLDADDPEALVGTAAGAFTHPESEALVADRHERLAAGEAVPPVEEKLVTVAGEVRHAILASTPIRYEGEAAIQTIATDITEQKRRERDLERQNERLDTFVSIISHDLKSPLNLARGYLEMAREEHDSGALETVAAAHDRMEEIIEETLTLARQGRTVREVEPVALDELATQCWSLVEAPDAELEVVDELRLRGDPQRLQHVFGNLFRNAVEHGGEAVTVRVGALEGTGFYVADDGPGIPAPDREEVFEPGVTTSDDGSGFGLAIVEQVVAAHGWTIGVTEAATGGARFEITGLDPASPE